MPKNAEDLKNFFKKAEENDKLQAVLEKAGLVFEPEEESISNINDLINHLHIRVDELQYRLERHFDPQVVDADQRTISSDGTIVCPCCGSEYTHPIKTFEGESENIRSEYAHYTQINFWCEGCDNRLGLRLRFHKGMTYVTWHVNTEDTEPNVDV